MDSSATTGLKGMQVTEHWQDYSVESESHEQSLMTNIEGRVIFPGRSVRASILRRGWGTLTIFISRGFNGRYGAHASAVVWGNEEHQVGVSTFRPDDTGDTEIVIR